jgi:thiamine-monophosphate kinase
LTTRHQSEIELTIADLGEKAFIRQVLGEYATTARGGTTEDCMVIDTGGDQVLVYSIDHSSLIDRPLPRGFEWRYHGRWLAACTCNDVLAMGARPRGMAIDLSLPDATPVAAVRDFYAGVLDVLTSYGAELQGGNTDINRHTETVGVCWGTVDRSRIIRRRGARPGDIVCVTTVLGVGWASYLLRKLGLFGRLSPEGQRYLNEYNLLPLAPIEPILACVDQCPGALTSGMDLSDGLYEFLAILAESSLGVVVDGSAFDADSPARSLLREAAKLLDVPAEAFLFEFGFDMPRAFGFTVAAFRFSEVSDIFTANGWQLLPVGTVSAGKTLNWRITTGLAEVPELWDDKCLVASNQDRWFTMIDRILRQGSE